MPVNNRQVYKGIYRWPSSDIYHEIYCNLSLETVEKMYHTL